MLRLPLSVPYCYGTLHSSWLVNVPSSAKNDVGLACKLLARVLSLSLKAVSLVRWSMTN